MCCVERNREREGKRALGCEAGDHMSGHLAGVPTALVHTQPLKTGREQSERL